MVDEHDVERAHRRAETLRRAGVQALPMLVGESWADGTVRALAGAHQAGWHVGGEVSDAYIAFRRLPALTATANGA